MPLCVLISHGSSIGIPGRLVYVGLPGLTTIAFIHLIRLSILFCICQNVW